jgi:hypothetical protein
MMSSPSISYGESVLSHLEKVQELSAEVQARRTEPFEAIPMRFVGAVCWGSVGPFSLLKCLLMALSGQTAPRR